MKVSELIEKLSKLDQNADIILNNRKHNLQCYADKIEEYKRTIKEVAIVAPKLISTVLISGF